MQVQMTPLPAKPGDSLPSIPLSHASPAPPSLSPHLSSFASSEYLPPHADSTDADEELAEQAAAAIDFQPSLFQRFRSGFTWSGYCPHVKLHGRFSRKLEYSFRTVIAGVLSMFIATYPPIAQRIAAPYLCPVLAMLSVQPTLGASIFSGWQVAKGVFYASLFGWICYLCGVGYANDTRWITSALLFLFSLWGKYFISPKETTTKKLALGLNATILITQLNFSHTWDYPWQILATSCLGSASGIVASIFPMPRPALKEVEERWKHGLHQTSHLFKLIILGFSCTSQSELRALMIHTRIDATLEQLLANRDAMKLRMKESENEFPMIFYRFFFGTYNHYTYLRHQHHFVVFDHLYRYMRCMAFSLQTLPYDAFHHACMHYLTNDLKLVSRNLDVWLAAVAETDGCVKRAAALDVPLRQYSDSITTLFDKYLQFRADMYFEGKLYLVDLHDGKKAVLRKQKDTDSTDDADHGEDDEAEGLLKKHKLAGAEESDRMEIDKIAAAVRNDIRTSPKQRVASPPSFLPVPSVQRARSSSTSHVRFHDEDELIIDINDEDVRSNSGVKSARSRTIDTDIELPHIYEDKSDEAGAQPAPVEPLDSHESEQSESSRSRQSPISAQQQAARDFCKLNDFMWSSEDIISLNFFMFQLSEFTKRSLKFRREPPTPDDADKRTQPSPQAENQKATGTAATAVANNAPSASTEILPIVDPAASHLAVRYYHMSSLKQAPQFVWNALKLHAKEMWDDFKAVCKWDKRLAIEAVKLAVAIELASINELVPRDYPTLYTRTNHGWWAPLTVAFTIADNMGGHFDSMVMRVLGTIVGSIVGYLIVEVCHSNVVGMVAALTVFNAGCSFNRDSVKYGYVNLVAGFTSMVIALGYDPTAGDAGTFAFVRIKETIVGVVVGMVIHNFVFPVRATTLIHEEVVKNITVIVKTFAHSFGKYQNRAGEYITLHKQFDAAHTVHQTLHHTIPHAGSSPLPFDTRIHVKEDRLHVPGHLAHASPGDVPTSSVDVNLHMNGFHAISDSPLGTINSITLQHRVALVKLDSANSFRKLGPALFASIEKQSVLCGAASNEPTLWNPSFPRLAYDKIINIEKNIGLYLYCMDLSLQRIIQSNSMYLLPDLNQNFIRLKLKVIQSVAQILKGLEEYQPVKNVKISPDLEFVIEQANQRPQRGRGPTTGTTASSNDQSEASRVVTRVRAHSTAQKDDLLSLYASLLELENRYKQWIDQRILAKRNQIRYAQEEEKQLLELKKREQQAARGVASGISNTDPLLQVDGKGIVLMDPQASIKPPSSNSNLEIPNAGGCAPLFMPHANMHPTDPVIVHAEGHQHKAGEYGLLTPIPLDTPESRHRRLTIKPNESFTSPQPAIGVERIPSTAPLEPVANFTSATDSKNEQKEVEGDVDDALTEAGNEELDPKSAFPLPPLTPPARAKSSYTKPLDTLSHMDITFTRSMDVLALNTFLFSTRGLIREIIALSQAVRVLLHMKLPNIYEESF